MLPRPKSVGCGCIVVLLGFLLGGCIGFILECAVVYVIHRYFFFSGSGPTAPVILVCCTTFAIFLGAILGAFVAEKLWNRY